MYNYENQKVHLFTDEGQRDFLEVRDKVKWLLKTAGAFRQIEAGGDSWKGMACLDRLVELKEIKKVYGPPNTATQYSIFIEGI